MEETDAMKLVGTGKTASQVLEARQAKRQANGGYLVPPPLPLAELADARVEDVPGSTVPKPNAQFIALRGWLQETFDRGGNADDLRKAWSAWSMSSQHQFRWAKGPLINFYEGLAKRARVREIELLNKAGVEAAPARRLELARANVAASE